MLPDLSTAWQHIIICGIFAVDAIFDKSQRLNAIIVLSLSCIILLAHMEHNLQHPETFTENDPYLLSYAIEFTTDLIQFFLIVYICIKEFTKLFKKSK